MQTVQRYVGYRTLRGVRRPTGYGYGLRMIDDPELGDVITHSGGVPGYGSNMRWVRGRRIGVIALANSTYAPVTELTARILDLVDQQGFMPDASLPTGEHIVDAAERLVALVNDWDDAGADELFADNVAHDEAYARRRATAEPFIADRPFAISVDPARDEAAGHDRAAPTPTGRTGRDQLLARADPTPEHPGVRAPTRRLQGKVAGCVLVVPWSL